MSKPFPALCINCKFSVPEKQISIYNLCTHPKVVSKDNYALARNFEGRTAGSSCNDERGKKSWLAPCGMKGKLWEGK